MIFEIIISAVVLCIGAVVYENRKILILQQESINGLILISQINKNIIENGILTKIDNLTQDIKVLETKLKNGKNLKEIKHDYKK